MRYNCVTVFSDSIRTDITVLQFKEMAVRRVITVSQIQ